jgi:uncharacterized protein (TIGR02217 family)
VSLETFPDNIVAEATAGPMFLTDIVTTEGGQEFRTAKWLQSRWKGEVRVPAEEMESKGRTLLAFYRAVGGGRANKFRVRDWSDYDVKNSEGVFIAIDSTHFQAYKRYDFGSMFHERKITRLRATPSITTGDATSPSWDLDTGILTVASGTPGHWTGIVDVPARFDTDAMDWHVVGRNAKGVIIEWDSLPLIEVRE